MSKKATGQSRIAVFGSLSTMVAVSLLVAMSIICGKYLAFGVGQVLRFSFENLPIMLSGILFGPAVGAVAGVVADLVGSLMVGYAINPIITVGAGAIGFVSGGCYKLLSKSVKMPFAVTLTISVCAAHFIGSVIIKTFGLSAFYDMPFGLLMAWRALNYLIIAGIELALICVILKNRSVGAMLSKMGRGRS